MFVVLALVLSLSLVLMACGGSKDDANSGDSKVLNVWAMGDEAKSLKELAQKFTKDTGIEVKVQVIPWANAHDKLLTAVASKSGPDVVQMELLGCLNLSKLAHYLILQKMSKKVKI